MSAEPWLLPQRALAAPFGPDWPAWTESLERLIQPFGLPPEELTAALRFGSALGWVERTQLPGDLRHQVAQGLAGAAAVAARLRLHTTLDWLLSRRAALGSWPDRDADSALLRAIARLDPGLLPGRHPQTEPARHALQPLASLRRYGPEEEYVVAALGEAIADYPAAPADSAAGWLLGQMNLAAAWVGLTRNKGEAYQKLVQRSPVVEDSWVGWLVLGRQEDELARHRAHLAGEAAWRARQTLAGDEPDAVAWQRAEAAGWLLAAKGQATAREVLACRPGVLTGEA